VLNNNLDDAILLDNVALSQPIDETISHIKLTGNVVLDASRNASIKLPIAEFTSLHGLIVSDLDGKPINTDAYKVYQLADGTVEVKFSLGQTNISALQVQATLLSSNPNDFFVHATQPIPPIDKSRLDAKALALLKKYGSNISSLKAVGGKIYSINPPNRDILNNLDGTPESFINAAADLEGKDCVIGNTEYALMSSSLEKLDEPYVDMAFGSEAISETNGFLTDDHAFTVSNDGYIDDATPGEVVSTDPMTQQYLANLRAAATYSNDTWDQQQTELAMLEAKRKQEQDSINQAAQKLYIAQQQVARSAVQAVGQVAQQAAQEAKRKQSEDSQRQQIITDLELVLGLGLAGGGLLLAPRGIGFSRRHLTPSKVGSAVSRVTQGRLKVEDLSMGELEEAYRFFNWLSYGGDRSFAKKSLIANTQTAPELLSRMRSGEINARRIRAYLRNPKQFEQEAGISGSSSTLRKLARHVIAS